MVAGNEMGSNLSVNTDRLQAALAGPLRRCVAPAAGYLKRWASSLPSIAPCSRFC
jgi:hypothetical protein